MYLLSLINIGNIIFITALIIIAYLNNIFAKMAIILIATLLVQFRFHFDFSNIFFLAMLLFGVILQEKLPFARFFNVVIAIIVPLVIFNAYLFII